MGPESPNQDSFSMLISESDFALYCVYDGHGPNGHGVSDITRTQLVLQFLSRLRTNGDDVPRAFEEAFEAMQAKFQEMTRKYGTSSGQDGLDSSTSGTTVTMAYHSIRKNRLWIAHVGDSRAVLGVRHKGTIKTEDMTEDHKPNLEKEKERIEQAGGRVVFDGFYNHRVFSKQGMYPGLNMSRALGDCIGHREAGLSAQPDIKEVDLSQYDEAEEVMLVLCTDGVWEFIQSHEAVDMMMGRGELCTKLAEMSKLSWDKWMQDSDDDISDDITGIVVLLKRAGQK